MKPAAELSCTLRSHFIYSLVRLQQQEEEFLTLLTSLYENGLAPATPRMFFCHTLHTTDTFHSLYRGIPVYFHYAGLSAPSVGCVTCQRCRDIAIITHYTHHYPCCRSCPGPLACSSLQLSPWLIGTATEPSSSWEHGAGAQIFPFTTYRQNYCVAVQWVQTGI